MEIKSRQVFQCPTCGTNHSYREEAEACYNANKWNDSFPEKEHLWKWNIFPSPCCSSHIVAIIPSKVDKSYCWADGTICTERGVSLFNSFGNNYFNVYASTPILVLDFMEAWNRYKLLPPVQYMKGAPSAVHKDIRTVLFYALEERKRELFSASLSIDQMMAAIAAYEFVEFTAPVTAGAEEKYKKLGRYLDTSYIPKSKIINGEKLLDVGRYSPEIAAYFKKEK
ncbi:MAG: hypothetical protein K2N48_10500 [Muribaculaceae bacterium]|nr:hypothetical protein [Muribaculaceae bacterium]